MNEAKTIAIFYGIMIILLSLIQAFVTSYSKRGYVLGVRLVGGLEDDSKVRKILKDYRILTILVGFALALLILGLSYIIENEALLNFIYILSIFLTYIPLVLANKKLKVLAKDQKVDKRKLVSLDYSKVKIFNKREFFGIYLGLLLIVIIFAIRIHLDYENFPDKLIMHMNSKGEIDGIAHKSYLSIQSPTIVSFFMLAVMFFANLSQLLSKMRISPDMPEESLDRLLETRRIWTYYFATSAILLIVLFQVGIPSFMKTGDDSLVKVLGLIAVGFSIGGSILIGKFRSVDGSALNKTGRYGYEEEDDRWILGGLIYYNPDDPAIFVEKRVGVGTTMNFANNWVKLIFLAVLLLPFVLGIVLNILEG
ncbi:MAG: DUF5808 domain-containing protein [Anaerococcus sp.]|uniref:DUF1648 domain-containing protein n=1 Tax=Anaerococcus sp. TaxID=1872515 RepID=UPI0026338C83|nr:DUF5808 domain-containing protein [Anaerococcus sp.]MCI5972232.1 DUF5808 domain-containing protein [Anaerococcus sp.]